MADTNLGLPVERKSIFSIISENLVPVFSILVILMLIVPLPAILLDFFMAMNIGFSIVILLIVFYTPKSSAFSSFPRVILLLTLFGLGLNVSSTRMILTKGIEFDGRMVRTFSKFVVGNADSVSGLIVGLVIFIILIVIQVLVITKGATRVAEVGARFALDSMAQKNFAVDNELSTGAITEEQAREKRKQIQRESDFFSAMDGSSKFVSGNVTAGIIITVVNLLAGLITGVLIRHEPVLEAAKQYCSLTIGDGLLSQIPSMLLSFSTGLIVTGNSSDQVVSKDIKDNFTISGWVYAIGGAVIAAMGLMPGMPWYLLMPMGGVSIFVGVRMLESEKKEKVKQQEETAKAQVKKAPNPADANSVAKLDPLSLELGYALIPLVNEENGAELLERITGIRKDCATDLGLVVPKIRIIDNMTLEPSEYSFKLKGIEIGRSQLKLGSYMCINTGGVTEEIQGEATKDPTFGMPAIWVPESRRADAERAGYAVVDLPTIIATHLTELIHTNAADILGKSEVKQLIDRVKQDNPVVVDEVFDVAHYTYGQVEKILKNLLREKVSIRNLETILDTLANYNPAQTNLWIITEKVRKALALQICLQYADSDRKLRVVSLGQDYTELFADKGVYPNDGSKPYVTFDQVDQRNWINDSSAVIAGIESQGFQPIIIAPEEVRIFVKHSIEQDMPGTIVLSVDQIIEVGNKINLEILGQITKSNGGSLNG
ncbi:MAG: flagellar biosynthesis protein FlhA [Treponema sp.]|nr:flagellar biosynthesis protein FlhA [Treponema sp.]